MTMPASTEAEPMAPAARDMIKPREIAKLLMTPSA
jgi:hypothetical protein